MRSLRRPNVWVAPFAILAFVYFILATFTNFEVGTTLLRGRDADASTSDPEIDASKPIESEKLPNDAGREVQSTPDETTKTPKEVDKPVPHDVVQEKSDAKVYDKPSLPALNTHSSSKRLNILYFTMDTLTWYIEAFEKKGGFGGEIVIGRCFHDAIKTLGHTLTIAGSDEEFERYTRTPDVYDLFIFDAWTVYDRNWNPRGFLPQRQDKIALFDCYGTMKHPLNGLPNVPASRLLTCHGYNSPPRTFLGFYMPKLYENGAKVPKSQFGVLWGKVEAPKMSLTPALEIAAGLAEIKANFQYSRNAQLTSPIGMLPRAEFIDLMSKAKFYLGVAHPLIGPSAIEAIAGGALLIIPEFNPPYTEPEKPVSRTQHDFVVDHFPKETYCLYDLRLDKIKDTLTACVKRALAMEMGTAYVSPLLTREAHIERVRGILKTWTDKEQSAA